nr:hypothetical protein [Tanacetum cinerariifolium]
LAKALASTVSDYLKHKFYRDFITEATKKKGGSASSTPPPTPIAAPTPTATVVTTPRLSAAAKGKQPARATIPTELTDVERT